MTPYFLPDERLMTALALASIRGVVVDVVIPEKSDHRFIDWATHGQYRPALERRRAAVAKPAAVPSLQGHGRWMPNGA